MLSVVLKLFVIGLILCVPCQAAAQGISECNDLLIEEQYKDAKSCFLELQKTANDSHESSLGLAIALFKLHSFDESLEILEAIEDKKRDDPRVHFWKGMVNRAKGNYDEAIYNFSICTKSSNSKLSIDAYKYRGITYINKTLLTLYPRYNKNGKYYPFPAIEIEDKDRRNSAIANLKMADFDFERYRSNTDKSGDMCFEHGLTKFLLDRGDDSISILEQCVEANKDIQNSNYMLGINYQDKDKHITAINYFEKSLQDNPHHSPSYYHRALSNLALGNKQEAIIDLKEATKLSDNKAYSDTLNSIQD